MSFRTGRNTVADNIEQRKMIKELTRRLYEKKDTIPFLAETEPAIPRSVMMGDYVNRIRRGGFTGLQDGGSGVTLGDTITQKIIPVIGNNGIFDIDWSAGNIFSIDLKKHSSIQFSNVPSVYELIQVQFKNPSNWKVIEWPDTLVEIPTIKVKSETLITLVSFGDGLVHFVTNVSSETGIIKASEIEDYTLDLSKIKTVSNDAGHVVISGGKSSPTFWGALNNIAGKIDLSKITINTDLDLQLKKIKNVKRITLAQETQTPASNGSIYLSGKNIKVKSNDLIINLSVIPELLKRDLSNMYGTIPNAKLSDINISKLKSAQADAGHVVIAGGSAPNYYGTLANIAGNLPASKITGLTALNTIKSLSEYYESTKNTPRHFDVPLNMEFRNLSKIKFKTILESSIGANDNLVELVHYDPANPQNYKTSAQQVMEILIHGEKTLAISALSDTLASKSAYNSVLEILGKNTYNKISRYSSS